MKGAFYASYTRHYYYHSLNFAACYELIYVPLKFIC